MKNGGEMYPFAKNSAKMRIGLIIENEEITADKE
jgi:hypothetical protein